MKKITILSLMGLSLGVMGCSQQQSDNYGLSEQDKDLPFHVGFAVASAEACEIPVDSENLKTLMMNHEKSKGRTQQQLDGIGANFDQVVVSTKASLKDNEAYCTDSQKEKVKADLQRFSVADFTGLGS